MYKPTGPQWWLNHQIAITSLLVFSGRPTFLSDRRIRRLLSPQLILRMLAKGSGEHALIELLVSSQHCKQRVIRILTFQCGLFRTF